MYFTDFILPILSFIIACISAILAFVTYKKYKEANKLSEEANMFAREANMFAREANMFAREANEIAKKSLNTQIAPEIKLTKLGLDPGKVRVYGGKNISWIGKNNIPKNLYRTILNSARTISITIINDKKYLLINLCYENTPKDDMGIVVNAFYLELECTKNPVDELSIFKAYSLLNPTTPFGTDIQVDAHIDLQNSNITIPIIYACPSNLDSSLNLGNIAKIAKETTDKINLIDSPSMAGKLISFIETAYLIKCRTSSNDEFLFSLYMKKDENGRLQASYMREGDEIYNEKYKKAKKIAGKEIQQLASIQWNVTAK